MGHPKLIAALLIASSVFGIANFAVYPVFSQNYPTTASISLGPNTTGYNRTLTVLHTYQTTDFTTSSSLFTQVMVAFVTSTTFFTYVQITFTSSTSTVDYPAPPVRPKPSSGSLSLKSSTSAPSRLTEYGESSSLFVVALIIVFGLLRRKMGNAEETVSESRSFFSM